MMTNHELRELLCPGNNIIQEHIVITPALAEEIIIKLIQLEIATETLTDISNAHDYDGCYHAAEAALGKMEEALP